MHKALNQTLRLVLNGAQGVIAVNKPSVTAMQIAVLAVTATTAIAGPENGVITNGNGSIIQNGQITTIHQSSQTLNTTWESFNIDVDETVNFVQPNKNSLAVNNILDNNGSRILGNINANGQVWLINPNGVFFGRSAQVNVGSILAATLNPISKDTEGKQVFAGTGMGAIINQGNITAKDGYVAFIGNTVSNQGSIKANNGTVALAAGSQVSLKFADNQLVSLNVDKSTLDNLAENKQLIQANGGTVLMSAGAKDSLLASVVNNEGKIEAKTVEHKNGKIILMGGMTAGKMKVSGSLDASAAKGDGGFIETSAAYVKVGDEAVVTTKAESGKTGTWLIDPVDFTVASTGGDITGTAVSQALAANNFQIQSTSGATGTAGDININDEISWSSNNNLTLTAQHDININSEITASGATAKLLLEYGQANFATGNNANYHINAKVNLQAGGNFSTKLGNDGNTIEHKVITDLGVYGSTTTTDLQGMRGDLSGHYVLGADIDASDTVNWNAGKGFARVGHNSNSIFTGTFNGLGHVITNLTVNTPTWSYAGLFGYTNADLQNVGLESVNISGRSYTGGLVGRTSGGNIRNIYTTGLITNASAYAGGAVGYLYNTTMSDAYSSATVIGGTSSYTGGLIGRMSAVSGNGSTVSNVYATGDVSSSYAYVGGLTGDLSNLTLNNAYATGNVSGTHYVGGLAGRSYRVPTITDVYATGNITASGAVTTSGDISSSHYSYSGGLIGHLYETNLSRAHATGDVLGTGRIGGLIGEANQNNKSFIVTDVYAEGDITATGDTQTGVGLAGGLIGLNQKGTLSNAYAIGNVSATGIAGGLVGQNSTDATIQNAYATGNVTNVQVQYIDANNETKTSSANYTGGLVGYNAVRSSVVDSYATGAVNGVNFTGGLVGRSHLDSIISGSNSSSIVNGNTHVGGLLGYNSSSSSVVNAYATGAVTATIGHIGGLVGYNTGQSTISDAYATAAVTSIGNYVGGLVGTSALKGSVITNVYATGDVQGRSIVGGLIGYHNAESAITNAYSTGNVTGSLDRAGGLVGYNRGLASINNAFATGAVNARNYVGGFVGHNREGATISNSYATGGVNGQIYVGGFVGRNEGLKAVGGINYSPVISNSYADNLVTGSSQVGGFSGRNERVIENSFWNADTYSGIGTITGTSTSNATGVSSTDFVSGVTYTNTGWDISAEGGENTVWRIYEGNTAPLLRSFFTNILTVDSESFNTSYDATTQSFSMNTTNYSNDPLVFGNLISARNAGVYSEGLYSNQLAYDIVGGRLTLSIDKLAINLDTATNNKIYDANNDATTTVSSTEILVGDDVTFTNTATFNNKNVGNGKTVSVSGIVASGADAGNYSFSSNTTDTASITQKQITVSLTADDKEYDGNNIATISDLSSNGVIHGDDVTFNNASVVFSDKQAGLNKTVTVSGITAAGADANNYSFNGSAIDTANIAQKQITLSATADDKVYDGNKTAIVSALGSEELVTGDQVSFNHTFAAFLDKHAGTSKSVKVSKSQWDQRQRYGCKQLCI